MRGGPGLFRFFARPCGLWARRTRSPEGRARAREPGFSSVRFSRYSLETHNEALRLTLLTSHTVSMHSSSLNAHLHSLQVCTFAHGAPSPCSLDPPRPTPHPHETRHMDHDQDPHQTWSSTWS